MGVRPLEAREVYSHEQIKAHFLYPTAGAFANPPTATGGAQLPKPRPLRGVTSTDKEILYLSSEESGYIRRRNPRKKVTVETGATSKKAGGSCAIPEKGEKKKSGVAASKSSGSAGSRAPESGATPSSLHEEEEEGEVEEEGNRLVTKKRLREETTAGETPPTQKAVVPQVIGKQGNLRSLYEFSPGLCFILLCFMLSALVIFLTIFSSAEALKKATEKVKGLDLKKAKEPEPKNTKFVIIHPKTTAEMEAERRVEEPTSDVIPEKEVLQETETAPTTTQDKAQGPEVIHVTVLDQPLKSKGPEVATPSVAAHTTPPPKLHK
ncbi:hypothetical protein Hanom_Chr08g00734871 [Helianthus anomalus]